MKKLFVFICLFAVSVSLLPSSFAAENGYDHEYTEGRLYSAERYSEITGGGQGSAIFGDTAIVCDSKGNCRMIDMTDRKLIAKFPLGSRNTGALPEGKRSEGTKAESWANHSNQIMFGAEKFLESDPFPLLYVTTGNSGDRDGTGAYISKCAVERILYNEESRTWSAQTVQIIEFNDFDNIPEQPGNPRRNMNGDSGKSELTEMYDPEDGTFKYISGNGYDASAGYQKVGWGWPASFVDSSPTEKTANKFYLFSARFRTTKAYEKSNRAAYADGDPNWNYYGESVNAYIVTEFDMPPLPASEDSEDYGGYVTLYPRDITDQFTAEYLCGVTQGGTMYRGKIYYSFGFGKNRTDIYTRNAVQVFDIKKGEISAFLPIYEHDSYLYEPECTSIYKGELILGMNGDGKYIFYSFGYVAEKPVLTPPDCTSAGKQTVNCSLCGDCLSSTEREPMLGHELEHFPQCDPTEQSDGTKEHYRCKRCRSLFSDPEGKAEMNEGELMLPALEKDAEGGKIAPAVKIAAVAAALSVIFVLFAAIRAVKRKAGK